MQQAPRISPPSEEAPRLRLLEGKSAALEASAASLRAWVVLFGSLAFSGGHGVFLVAALTRLSKLPARYEIGSEFQLVVVGWFVAAAPLAFLAAGLRRRFLGLSSATGWTFASATLGVTVFAFVTYLRAVALA